MTLQEVLKDLEYEVLQGTLDIEISDVEYDSRKVKDNSLFVCMTGFSSDGHGFITRAYDHGAKAVIVERDLNGCHEALEERAKVDGFGNTYIPYGMTVVKVKDSRAALAVIAATWFGNPADKLTLIGITGTKGKTTTAHMVKSILDASGLKAGMIGTIGTVIINEQIESKLTTPESFELHRLFAKMVEAGCTHCVMEISSQAVKMRRIYGINYAVGAFINISPDHIGPGEHENFEEYFQCKKHIFEQAKTAVINIDDEHGAAIAKEGVSSEKMITVSLDNASDLSCDKLEDIWKEDMIGTRMHVKGLVEAQIELPMPGKFNAENAMVAIATCKACGINDDAIIAGLRNTTVKGRMQVIPEASDIATFIIDYAHNAISMESILTMLKGYKPEKLICLFGAGGNRPKQRRYDMGEAAGRLADLSILTEDNSRFEEPEDIIKDIVTGVDVHQGKYEIIVDRRKAIEHAIDIAKPGYIVVLCGKGHETYLDAKGVKTYFCEEDVIKEYISKIKK